MRYSFLGLVIIGSVFGLAACGDDPAAPEVLNIGGNWSYTESISNSSISFSCQNEGTMTINQDESNFTGSVNQTGVCTDGQGNTYDNSGSGSIGGGQISGEQVSFSAGGCDYNGSISGSPPNRLSGSVSCTVAISGTNYVFTGTFTATK